MEREKMGNGEVRTIAIKGEKWWCLRDLHKAIGCAQAVSMMEVLPHDTMRLEYTDGRCLLFVNARGLEICQENADSLKDI